MRNPFRRRITCHGVAYVDRISGQVMWRWVHEDGHQWYATSRWSRNRRYIPCAVPTIPGS